MHFSITALQLVSTSANGSNPRILFAGASSLPETVQEANEKLTG
jgi:hypothetical protein